MTSAPSITSRLRSYGFWIFVSVGAIILFCLSHSVVGILKLRWLGYGWNMALYEQEIWNGAHGRFFQTSLWGESRSQLGLDLFLTQLLFIPLYMLGGQTTESLIILQIMGIAIGCLPIYWIAQRIIKQPWGGFIGIAAYLLFPAVSFLANREFDPRPFAMTALLLAIYAYREQRVSLFVGACLFALASKSDLAFPVFGFGLLALIDRRGWRWIALCFGLAGGWLLISLYIVIPFFSHTSSFQDIAPSYGYLGNSASEILITLFTRPVYALNAIWSNTITLEKAWYVIALLAPYSGLSLVGWRWLVPALPTFVFNFFSTSSNQWDIRTRHQAALIPFLCVAALYGFVRISIWLERRTIQQWHSWLTVVFIALLIMANIGYKNPLISTIRYHEPPARVLAAQAILRQVPAQAPVSSTAFLLPYLARRPEVQVFEDRVRDPLFVSLYPFPPKVEYFVGDRTSGVEEQAAIKALQQDFGWQTIDEREGFILLKDTTITSP